MAKERPPIPPKIATEVMFEHDRACCVCRTTSPAVQIHHIDEDPSNNVRANLTVLCLDHHHETQIRGGFGRKLGPDIVRRHRDDWIERVKRRRDKADELAASAMSGVSQEVLELQNPVTWSRPYETSYMVFVNHLPDALAAAYKAARPLWAGSGLEMVDGYNLVIDTLKRLWLGLSNWFPPGHFGCPPDQYLERY
ncbi:MAG: HNH endonuclease signature motif containing protein [Methyloceanibacter sp.]